MRSSPGLENPYPHRNVPEASLRHPLEIWRCSLGVASGQDPPDSGAQLVTPSSRTVIGAPRWSARAGWQAASAAAPAHLEPGSNAVLTRPASTRPTESPAGGPPWRIPGVIPDPPPLLPHRPQHRHRGRLAVRPGPHLSPGGRDGGARGVPRGAHAGRIDGQVPCDAGNSEPSGGRPTGGLAWSLGEGLPPSRGTDGERGRPYHEAGVVPCPRGDHARSAATSGGTMLDRCVRGALVRRVRGTRRGRRGRGLYRSRRRLRCSR